MPRTAAPPWLSLPDDLKEKILERLPLSDYVRFPAVCRRWRSIQTDHRRRHAPSPPPMVKLPWLISRDLRPETLSCYSPLEGRIYRIKSPSYRDSVPDPGLLFRKDSIFNPISQIDIPFPEPVDKHYTDYTAQVAVLPPPGLVVFVVRNYRQLFVFRVGDPQWTKLKLPIAKEETVTDAVTLGGRLYCIFSRYEQPTADHLLIVDPVPSPPTVCSYRLEDWANILREPTSAKVNGWRPIQLVESDGEMLMVKEARDTFSGSILRFHVLRADVSKRMWTKVERLGDQLLLFHLSGAVSLLAADVGLKKNCIYFHNEWGHDNWKVFDLGVGMVIDTSFPDYPQRWSSNQPNLFLPSIC